MSKSIAFAALFLSLQLPLAHAATNTGEVIANNTPKLSAATKNLGEAEASTAINVTLWLHPHNRSDLDTLAKELYNPASPNYRQWLDRADFMNRFAPTEAEAKTVQTFLTEQKMQIVSVDPHNFFVRARATVADAEAAFHVKINNYEAKGKTFRANVGDPAIAGPAGALVAAVYGLDSMEYEHPFITQSSLLKEKPKTPPGNATAGPNNGDFFTSNCFTGTRTETYSNMGSDPIGTYKGNGYTGNQYGCAYTPPEIQTAYNLKALYKEGYDGTGQTIVIVDWCGSPTVMQDANAFSARFGLPALTSTSFRVVDYPTASTCSSPNVEINLDVEWAHAIAPGAHIVLLVPPSATFEDVDAGLLYAVEEGFGNVISNSYGSEEYYTPKTILTVENFIVESAAVLGISANFSSGDYGDFTFDFPQFDPPSVSAPADSPYATAVGGISLALNSSNAIQFQAGWGTNETLLAYGGPYVPPANFGFTFGSGGGPSGFFSKPEFQSKLKGTARQVPDISWLADPFTAGVIAISEPGIFPSPVYEGIGGTSLACPMFSALWAIANQEAGSALGQAAQYVYTMPKGTITDIVPVSSATNVTAKIQDAGTTTKYSAAEIAEPLENTTQFLSVLWDVPLQQDLVYAVTFGTDSGLTVTPGWDNVTGVGVPNGKAFADHFKQ